MTEISRDGKRVYFTNSLYSTLGHAVLSRRRAGRAGDVQRGRERRHRRSTASSSSTSGRTTARTRSACRAATARPIRSAIPRLERSDVPSSGGAVAHGRRDRRLSRPQPGDGLAARGGQRPRPRGAARRCSRPCCRWAPGTCWRWRSCWCRSRCSSWLLAWSAPIRIAAGRAGAAVRHLPAARAAPSALRWRASADAARAVVVPDGDRARGGADAAAVRARPVCGPDRGARRTAWRRGWAPHWWCRACTRRRCCRGAVAAWVVYRYLGLRVLNRAWINLDTVWAASLVAAGGASAAMVALA